jgi:hypothetical protein
MTNEIRQTKKTKAKTTSKGAVMPVQRVPGGYRWGTQGKVYRTKAAAERQGRAAYASGYKGSNKKK